MGAALYTLDRKELAMVELMGTEDAQSPECNRPFSQGLSWEEDFCWKAIYTSASELIQSLIFKAFFTLNSTYLLPSS